MGIFAVTLIVCGASFATAGIPDLEESTADAVDSALGTLSLFCLPNGAGSEFTDAYVKGGTGGPTSTPIGADATIELFLRDGGGVAINDYPAANMTLEWDIACSAGLYVCVGGTISDQDTVAPNGYTLWQDGLLLGGHAECNVKVLINGAALTSSGGIALHVNSADENADGVVNLADVGIFAADYAVTYPAPYKSDFVADGVMNVADVGKMAQGVGASCP
jgi:hypothetical protein